MDLHIMKRSNAIKWELSSPLRPLSSLQLYVRTYRAYTAGLIEEELYRGLGLTEGEFAHGGPQKEAPPSSHRHKPQQNPHCPKAMAAELLEAVRVMFVEQGGSNSTV